MNVMPAIDSDSTATETDNLWYKDAIIYQLHVKAFADSNNDGIGDFAGLTDKLDYLQDLGVTALWLLPFYPSPGRDDGYDIADYGAINPDFGTMKDFRRFIFEAKRRGLRVITELVINHTSDQHDWFKRARRSDKNSSARNWYVWSDTDQKYQGTRIIFTDTEKSNWTWDPEAGQFYWHRFFSHQPDLNFDNPRVVSAVVQVMKRWLDAGVDGFRLDAIPYLCERDGTNNENLPETHAVIKQLRAELDDYARGRGQSMARGRPAIFRRWRRMPDGLSLPADAADLHGAGAGGSFSDHRHSAPDPGHSQELPVGAVSAQSRRTDAGDGHRRRARLSLVDLCPRSTRPHQCRDPSPPCPVDGQRSPQDRIDEFAAAVVSGHADHLLR
jgi:hypothetical protein